LVKLVRKWLDAQLPEPLKRVQAREERQREKVRALVAEWQDDDDA
jgi:hypothetical protein